jgi:hypothetical protein
MKTNYFWVNNKVTEQWFNGRRKPDLAKNKLTNLNNIPYRIPLPFNSPEHFMENASADLEAFMVLRLTKPVAYRATGLVYLNNPAFMAECPMIWNHVTRNYEKREVLVPLFEINYYKWDHTYDFKTLGASNSLLNNDGAEVFETHPARQCFFDHAKKDHYIDLLGKLPTISEELFSIIPKVNSKK